MSPVCPCVWKSLPKKGISSGTRGTSPRSPMKSRAQVLRSNKNVSHCATQTVAHLKKPSKSEAVRQINYLRNKNVRIY